MAELRKDPILERWVIVAESRAERPFDLAEAASPSPTDVATESSMSAVCPFCPGNEHETPPEVLAYRAEDSQANCEGWMLRVVPNRYPAVERVGESEGERDGFYQSSAAFGQHEVIVECAEHVASTSQLTQAQVADVLRCYRDRLARLQQDERLAYAQIFKNVGAAGGVSLEHSHSQLIATAIVPTLVQQEWSSAEAYYEARKRCVFCDIVEQEQTNALRIVSNTDWFVAFCPYASRFAYETWILPKAHASHYEAIASAAIDDLARLLQEVIRRVEKVMGCAAYNYVLHTAPLRTQGSKHFHWHLEILPRLTGVAGYEWSSGIHINSVAPERAAATLRSQSLESR